MDEEAPRVRFTVSCPVCRREALAEYRYADLLGALINHRPIRLYAACHDTSWAASYIEVQQIRSRIGAAQSDATESPGERRAVDEDRNDDRDD
jgi:hypothetical protein